MAFGGRATRDVTVRLLGNVKNYHQQMGIAGDITSELVEELSGLDEAMHRTFQRAGRTMVGFGLAMQASATLWTREAIQWESAFADVVKTVDATDSQLTELGTTIRQMSARDIPQAAEGLAQLASLAGQLGVSTDAIDEFTETAAKLGIATELSASQAIFSMSQFTNIMGEAEDKVENVSSALVEMGNTTKTTEGSILDFSTRMAGAANVVGLTSSEVMGISAAFASAGVEAERGGTAVQKVLLSMNDAVTTGGEKLDSFARTLGMTSEQFKEMFRQDPSEIFARFVESLTSAGDEANTILRKLELTDQRLVSAFLSVANAGEDVRSIMNRSNAAYRENNALSEEAARFIDTVAQQFTLLKNAVTESWRALGEGFIPLVRLALGVLIQLVNIFNSIPQPVKTAMGLFVGFGGILLTIIGTLMTFSRAMEMAFHANKLRQVGMVSNAIAGLRAGFLNLEKAIRVADKTGSRAYLMFARLGGSIRRVTQWVQQLAVSQLSAKLAAMGDAVAVMVARIQARLNTLSVPFLGANMQMGLAGLTNKTTRFAREASTASRAAAGMGGSIAKSQAAAGGAAATIGGPLTLAAIAATGAFMGLKWWNERVEAAFTLTEEEASKLAETLGLAEVRLGEFQDTLDEVAGDDPIGRIQQDGQDLLNIIKNLNEEGKEPFLVEWGFQQIAAGDTPEQVQKAVEDLAKAGGIEFDFDFTSIDTKSLEDRFENLGDVVEGVWERSKEGAIRYDAAAQGALVEQAKRVAAGFQGTEQQQRQALLTIAEFERKVNEQRDLELLDPDTGEHEKERIAQRAEGMIDLYVDNVKHALGEAGIEGLDTSHLIPGFGKYSDFTNLIEDLAEEGVVAKTVLEDINTETMTQAEMIAVLERAYEGYSDQRIADLEEESALMAMLGPRYHELEKSAKRSYAQEEIRSHTTQQGHVATIEMLEEELARLEESGAEHLEHGRLVRSELEKTRQEFDKIDWRELQRELARMSTADAIDELRRRLAALDQTADNFHDKRSKYLDEIASMEDQAVQSLSQAIQQWEQLQQRKVDAQRRHSEAMTDAQEEQTEALSDARKDLDDELAQINEDYEDRLDQRSDKFRDWAKLTEREWSQHTNSLARIIANATMQNQMFGAWQQGLEKLRARGMSEEAIEQLGLTESPKQLQQVERILQGSDKQINKLNRLVEERSDQAVDYVEKNSEDLAKEAAESREEAVSQYEQTVADINDRFNEQIADLNEDLARELRDIEEEVAAIGESTGSSYAELIAKGVETGHENIIRLARELEEILDKTEDKVTENARTIKDVMEDLQRNLSDFFGWDWISKPDMSLDKMFGEGGTFRTGTLGLLGNISSALTGGTVGAVFDALANIGQKLAGQYGNTTSNFVPGGIPGGPSGPNSADALKSMVYQKMTNQGWGPAQWGPLDQLIQHESSWTPTAQNPTSSAYGLFQFLDQTWGYAGVHKTSDPAKQTDAGLAYIKDRYGSPAAAWNFWNSQSPNWYAEGSMFNSPQMIGVGESGPEAVIPLNNRGVDFLAATMRQYATPSGNGGDMMREVVDALGAMAFGDRGGMSVREVNVYPKDFNEFYHQLNQRKRRSRLVTQGGGTENRG